jgi:hypothetical protein
MNHITKKLTKKGLFPLAVACFAFLLSLGSPNISHATTAAGFNPGRIIDDAVMTNSSSMNVAQIQAFLNSKVPVCDTNHAGFYGTSGTWYGPPFTCLKDYTENGLAAAQIIYNASQNYSINPQVLLVLLQKEESLITDTWPASYQYKSATGYGCPDSTPGVCNSSYYGFTNQINNAAKLFHSVIISSPTWYSPYILGNNKVYYNPGPYNSATKTYYGRFGTKADIEYCGSTTVNIQNLATVSLYDYTPYQPNQAAIDGWDDGCGSFGNRNFYSLFTEWFGDPRLAIVTPVVERYNENTWLGRPLMNQICTLRDNGCYQLFANGTIYWSSATGAQVVRGGIKDKWVNSGFENGTFGYPTSGELTAADGGVYQTFQGGTINWTPISGAHGFTSNIFSKWNELGAENGFFGRPLTDTLCGLKNNGCYQLFMRGTIYWTTATGAQSLHGGIKDKWVSSGFENGPLGYPTSGEIPSGSGAYQTFQGGTVYWSANAGAVQFTNELYAAWTTYGAEAGFFGKPVTDTLCGLKNNGCYQLFKTGAIYWTAETGAQVVHGGIKDKWVSVGFENGALGYPTSGEIPSGNGVYQTFQGGTIYWTPTSGASIVYN